MKKNTYKTIYHKESALQGFSLYENSSSEKKDISNYLLTLINNESKSKKSYKILDLGGGSGLIWLKFINGITNNLKIKTSIFLVDSSKKQIRQAKLFIPDSNWFKSIHSDAYDFLQKSKRKFDLISCIHLLAGFNEKNKKLLIKLCLSKLKKEGKLLIIHPNSNNPLSLIKKHINKKYFNENIPKLNISIPASYKIQIKTKKSSFTLNKDDLNNLIYFLFADKLSNQKYEQKYFMNIYKYFEKNLDSNNSNYKIVIINDYYLVHNS